MVIVLGSSFVGVGFRDFYFFLRGEVEGLVLVGFLCLLCNGGIKVLNGLFLFLINWFFLKVLDFLFGEEMEVI